MRPSEVNKIVELRNHVIKEYNDLIGPNASPTAIMKQEDVAWKLETIIRSIDDILKPHVSFDR